jgi:hypothetical protein
MHTAGLAQRAVLLKKGMELTKLDTKTVEKSLSTDFLHGVLEIDEHTLTRVDKARLALKRGQQHQVSRVLPLQPLKRQLELG